MQKSQVGVLCRTRLLGPGWQSVKRRGPTGRPSPAPAAPCAVAAGSWQLSLPRLFGLRSPSSHAQCCLSDTWGSGSLLSRENVFNQIFSSIANLVQLG